MCAEELSELFTPSDSADRDEIHKVWGCPGHLFVTLNKGKKLKTYDVAVPSSKQGSPKKSRLYLHLSPSPIVQVCFFKKENSPAFVVYQNGLVEMWTYSYQGSNGQWSKVGYFILSDPGGAVISSVLLDEDHDLVFWLERLITDGQHSNRWLVRFRTLTVDLGAKDKPCYVGKATTLLVNCPPCSLYQTNGAVCIWPGSPSPPGLHFIWHSKNRGQHQYLNTCVISQGCVQKTDCQTALDMKVVAADFRYLWVKVADQCDYDIITNITGCLSSNHVYLMSSNGAVHSISGTKEYLHTCNLSNQVDIQQAKDFFVHRLTLGVIADQMLSLLSLETGELVQQIKLSQFTSVTDIHSWCIVGSVPKVGIWCEDGIWILQMSAVDKIHAKEQYKRQTSETIFFKYSHAQVAAHTQLEDVYQQFSKGRPPAIDSKDDHLQVEALVGEEGLQSPALVVAALHETSDGLQSQAQSIVNKLCEMYGIPGEGEDKQLLETPLNQQVLPLLRQYWQTHKVLKQCFQRVDGRSSELITSIEDDLLDILSENSTLSVDLKRSQLAYLISKWPKESLQTFVRHFRLGDVNSKGDIHIHIPGPSDPNVDSFHPLTRLAIEAPESASGFPLFEILCRLLYMQYPRYLVAFIEGCQSLRDTFKDVSAFTRKKHALQLCNLAIQSLPSKLQGEIDETVKMRAQLLNMSGKTNYIQEALRLYLTHHMWDDAIRLVKIHADHSRQHSQLFHILISSMIQEREVFQQYNTKIWTCTPNTMSALDFLQFLQQHHQSSLSTSDQNIFCLPENDLQLGHVKNQLLMLIGQEKT